jgi:energy-coupling factor transporter ATP-binding protein EcfA2
MTESSSQQYTHPSGDQVLDILAGVTGTLGEYVRTFPGRRSSEANSAWLDKWFSYRTEGYLKGTAATVFDTRPAQEVLAEAIQQRSALVTVAVRLVSIQPHYFRGFRALSNPINLTGKLVVIDGRNSSGKTSLAEAIEWLLTGQLTRRLMQELGSARELENCISNQLRPANEESWVEAVFATDTGEQYQLRRVLKSDYGTTQTSQAASKLFLNGKELNSTEESELWFRLFAGVPPVLMQHTLGMFVHSTPAQRRDYFEQLLRLEELTYLIEKSVVGDARLHEFQSPLGGAAIHLWENLKATVQQRASKTGLRNAETLDLSKPQATLGPVLATAAKREFGSLAKLDVGLDEARQILTEAQRSVRQQKFPLLDSLRPRQVIDDRLLATFDNTPLNAGVGKIAGLFEALAKARAAAQHITQAQRSVVQAYDLLAKAGVIEQTADEQTCPLCDYQTVPTFTSERQKQILSWQPLEAASELAQQQLVSAIGELRRIIDSLVTSKKDLIPTQPQDMAWNKALETSDVIVQSAVGEFRSAFSAISNDEMAFDESVTRLRATLDLSNLSTSEAIDKLVNEVDEFIPLLSKILDRAREYAGIYQSLERAVASIVREDPDYSLREAWLAVAANLDDIAVELQWENAKKRAQAELVTIRERLIEARKDLLNARRDRFGNEMTAIWSQLRSDRYSAFSRLFVPEPRGRGFPIEIEVKAILDDGTQQKEVDALRVFSESQVNVLGLAAYMTRAKLLGHRVLVLDDPVQSMDEDHFKTFSSGLIKSLLLNDFQVVILTHNDMFAREISYACAELENYVTMQIRHSRRQGCQVDEGNRRVAERLKIAERRAEEGELDKAWLAVRLALERLYTVVNLKYGPKDFNPLTWLDQTAEYMWDNGVGNIIESQIPGSGSRLKEILQMTAAGAHDKSAKGMTDLANAVADIRKLMPKLRIGDG